MRKPPFTSKPTQDIKQISSKLPNSSRPLNDLFNDAIEKRRKYQYKDAHSNCDMIIRTFNQRDLANISLPEKKLLAMSHTLKADMLCIGSVADQILARDHVNTALQINPNFHEAKLIKDILYIENNFPFSPS